MADLRQQIEGFQDAVEASQADRKSLRADADRLQREVADLAARVEAIEAGQPLTPEED